MPFVGRSAELAQLRQVWEEVSSGQGMRVVCLIAETGVGKSRLVQQWYHNLATDTQQWDPFNYWPDTFQHEGSDLQVIPSFPPDLHPSGPPAFFWFGLRWSDPHARNAIASAVLPSLHDQLQTHIELFRRLQERWRERLAGQLAQQLKERARLETMLALLADQALPMVGGHFIDIFRETWQGMGKYPTGIVGRRSQEIEELTEQLLERFRQLFKRNPAPPLLLWLDDVHWIDREAERFIRQLLKEGRLKRWPILLVATCWPREWHEHGIEQLLGQDSAWELATVHSDESAQLPGPPTPGSPPAPG